MTVNINVSLPEFLVNKIDQQRGDIPRSKFILRLLERATDLRIHKFNQKPFRYDRRLYVQRMWTV